MKKWIFLSLLLALTINTAFACTEDGQEGILPENDMYLPADMKTLAKANMDENKFNQVIDKVVAIYEPIVSSMGGSLSVSRNWTDGTVNAYAQRWGSIWRISMFGGLARHEAVTEDGFALVVCHELGHHIGGAPQKGTSWASNEGQSDYFATLKCLRKAFKNDDNKAIVAAMDVPTDLADSCKAAYTDDEEIALCIRSSMAGLSTAVLFKDLRRETVQPKVSTPDANVVSSTSHYHPATQCRMDTYHAGAICLASENDDVSNSDEEKGVCYRANGQENGARPLCWFKPARD